MYEGKKLEDMTYNELVEYVSQQLHSALLEGGGKSLKAAVHLWLGQAIVWNEYQGYKEKKNKRRN
jgi:hypothetical protein